MAWATTMHRCTEKAMRVWRPPAPSIKICFSTRHLDQVDDRDRGGGGCPAFWAEEGGGGLTKAG